KKQFCEKVNKKLTKNMGNNPKFGGVLNSHV
ncbi:hypothetical protein SMU99_07510, partial [Streptococcus mutans 24]